MARKSCIDAVRIKSERNVLSNISVNVSPQKLSRLLKDFDRGQIAEAAKLFYLIAKRDDTVVSVTQKRKAATARLPWEIVKKDDEGYEELAQEQAKFLEEFYNNIKGTSVLDCNSKGSLSFIVRNMLDCLGCQYAIHELIWRPQADGKLGLECKFVPLWCFENLDGYLKFKQSSYDAFGVALDQNWLVCCNSIAYMEATSIAYLVKKLAIGDWSVFSQRFGTAFPAYTSKATPDSQEWNNAVNVVSSLANESGIVISEGEKFELMQANATGLPMPSLVERMDRAIATIWRGSDLSTLSSKNGSGAALQASESTVLEDSDAIIVEESLDEYITKAALRWKFGEDAPMLAYITLRKREKKDKLQLLEIYERAEKLGCPVAKDNLYENLELRKPREGEEVVGSF